MKILRLPEVMEITGLSRSAIYARISKKDFPRQISLGGGMAVGWIESELNDWLQDRITERNNNEENK